MKAISLHQPWATFVAMKWKTIETRCHSRFSSLVGQRIAIHAAKKIDNAAFFNEFLLEKITPSPLQVENFIRWVVLCRGRVICTARVVDARWAPNVDVDVREEWMKRAMCETAGKFCLFFEDIHPITKKLGWIGRQGIFEVPDEVICGATTGDQTRRLG